MCQQRRHKRGASAGCASYIACMSKLTQGNAMGNSKIGDEKKVRIVYWVQDTIESGHWTDDGIVDYEYAKAEMEREQARWLYPRGYIEDC